MVALLLASCNPTPERVHEDCSNVEDDDFDGLVDCLDPDCLGDCPEICSDGEDNDGDFAVDCEDSDCDSHCMEDCTDERDNDGDTLVDCQDQDCFGQCPEDCLDGWDNDADGWVDCADVEDCIDDCPEDCFNGVDDNGDFRIDCDDPRCPCDEDLDGWVSQEYGGPDCDDSNPNVYPFALEICNEIDDNCDTRIDDDDPSLDTQSAFDWYPDRDADGSGDGRFPVRRCSAPDNYVSDNLDCDDAESEVHPGVDEVCDFIDNDCDGFIDQSDPDAVLPIWYLDMDMDGFGSEYDNISACVSPPGAITVGGDCDDLAPQVNPDATELCGDGVDQDCDGQDVPC